MSDDLQERCPSDQTERISTGAIVENEFASVTVGIDVEAGSARLRIEDLRTGRVRYFDALELESIVWMDDRQLARLMDPSAHRWRE